MLLPPSRSHPPLLLAPALRVTLHPLSRPSPPPLPSRGRGTDVVLLRWLIPEAVRPVPLALEGLVEVPLLYLRSVSARCLPRVFLSELTTNDEHAFGASLMAVRIFLLRRGFPSSMCSPPDSRNMRIR